MSCQVEPLELQTAHGWTQPGKLTSGHKFWICSHMVQSLLNVGHPINAERIVTDLALVLGA